MRKSRNLSEEEALIRAGATEQEIKDVEDLERRLADEYSTTNSSAGIKSTGEHIQ